VWACAANRSSARDYQEFLAAVRRLPDATHLELWMEKHHLVDETRKSARAYLDRGFDTLENRLNAAEAIWSKRAFQELRDLGEEIAVAYG
jgi:hypothetical protein